MFTCSAQVPQLQQQVQPHQALPQQQASGQQALLRVPAKPAYLG
jgi:hypothetical protein